MSKVKFHELKEQDRNKYLSELYDMISLLKTREDVKNFMKDLLTLSESVMISRRIQIAKMLLMGATYEEIRDKLKVGYTNITQVDKWLNNGFGGYKKIIKEHNKNKKSKEDKKKSDWDLAGSFAHLRKKYPAHFWLFNLVKDKLDEI